MSYRAVPDRLAGKRILITGSATGIGRAAALRTAAEGARVAGFDRNDADGARTVTDIEQAGGTGRHFHVDVANQQEVAAAVEQAVQWLGGGIDVLLHAAGVLQGAQVPLPDFSEETWDAVMDANLKGTFLMVKHVSRPMIAAGAGVMVLVASGAGVVGGSSSFAYGSSKGGMHGLALAMEHRLSDSGIRVNDVLPGSIDTPLKRAQLAAVRDATGDESTYQDNIRRLASPDGIGALLAFLASDDAAFVRGSIRTI